MDEGAKLFAGFDDIIHGHKNSKSASLEINFAKVIYIFLLLLLSCFELYYEYATTYLHVCTCKCFSLLD